MKPTDYPIVLTDHQCQQDGAQFSLSKLDVLANVVFPITWNQRQCLCCFKDTKNYEAYNNIIQMVIVTAIRLLHSYEDETKIFLNKDRYSSHCLVLIEGSVVIEGRFCTVVLVKCVIVCA